MTTTAETTDMQSLLAFARDRGACAEARLWLNTQTDPHVAWEMCERPDWMIWFARRRSVERKVLVRIACDCARTALPPLPPPMSPMPPLPPPMPSPMSKISSS